MKNLFIHLKSLSWTKIFAIFAAISLILRVVFFVWQKAEIEILPPILFKTFIVGFFYDILALSYIALLPLAYYTFIPSKVFASKIQQKINAIFYFIFLFVIIFSAVSEIIFWDEFQTRFNFIAVDYLIYTTEVIENIVQSYPIAKIIAAILLATSLIFYFSHKKILTPKFQSFKCRIFGFCFFAIFLSVAFFGVDNSKISHLFLNKYVNEISQNGIYQLFSAYRNNEIDYDLLYATKGEKFAIQNLRASLLAQEPRVKFLNQDDISRLIPAPKNSGEKKHNIIFIVIESLSADFMQTFGNQENITPNLDKLAKNGLFFSNLKATGTRTVRGLEALSLSIPPTPGNSIVRRPKNENLFNISSPLKDRGYESKFIYGGDGYFDNMDYFFENNGFQIVDRPKFLKDEISFSNAWGVDDEDLFNKTISEADLSFSKQKPFLNFVMTTSNHRPFTYPNGKIDIDSKTGRNGAVKYTDYAIGKLIEKASKKPWFDNTIFVFVADHCAGSAGNTEVPLWRYQIPAIFYAPKIIKPQIFTQNISQIDLVPTLFGLMNFSYKSKFFGIDVLTNQKTFKNRSFVSTYTDIGYFENNSLYLLKPKKEVKFFNVVLEKYGFEGSKEILTDNYDEKKLDETISYYESASHLFKNGKLKNFNQKN